MKKIVIAFLLVFSFFSAVNTVYSPTVSAQDIYAYTYNRKDKTEKYGYIFYVRTESIKYVQYDHDPSEIHLYVDVPVVKPDGDSYVDDISYKYSYHKDTGEWFFSLVFDYDWDHLGDYPEAYAIFQVARQYSQNATITRYRF